MLLNKSAIRGFLLDYAARSRSHDFSRVAPGVYDKIESEIRKQCRALVDQQPSKGKTIR